MITASIVLYNNPIEECSLIVNQLLDNPVDCIYLVDHSPNTRLDFLSHYSDRIVYLRHQNSGYGAGHNYAFQYAKEINRNGFHIVTNADISLKKGTIQALEAFMMKNSSIGCCMPRILNRAGEEQRMCKYIPSPMDLFSKRFLPKILSKRIVNRLTMGDCDYNRILSVPWVSGCFMFLRMETIIRTHGFDESFFMYAEDIDFSRRIYVDYDNVYYPEATIFHLHKAESYHSFRMCFVHISSIIKYFNKYGWFFDKTRTVLNTRAKEINGTNTEHFAIPTPIS